MEIQLDSAGFMVAFLLYTAYVLTTILLFRRLSHLDYIKNRSIALTTIIATLNWMMWTFALISISSYRNDIPCAVFNYFGFNIFPITINLCLILRKFNIILGQKVTEYKFAISTRRNVKIEYRPLDRLVVRYVGFVERYLIKGREEDMVSKGNLSEHSKEAVDRYKMKVLIHAFIVMQHPLAILFPISVGALVGLVGAIIETVLSPVCTFASTFSLILSLASVVGPLSQIITAEFKQINDNFHISLETRATAVIILLCTTMQVISSASTVMGSDSFRANGLFWILLLNVIIHLTFIILPMVTALLYRSTSSKMDDMEKFEKILSTASERDVIKEMMVQEFCVESIMFYEEYKRAEKSNLSNNLSNSLNNNVTESNSLNNNVTESNSWSNNSLQKIVKDFICPGSLYELNISDELRQSVLNADSLTFECLRPVYDQVLVMIYQKVYQKYIKQMK